MEIVETHLQGKHLDPARCEDRIVTTERLAAVVDGATNTTVQRVEYEGQVVTTGWLAAELIAEALRALQPGLTPRETVDHLTDVVDDAFHRLLGGGGPERRPGATIVVYDHTSRLIWRVGDTSFRIGDTVHQGRMRVDEIASSFRAAVVATYTPEELAKLETDPGREAILPLLQRQTSFANQSSEYGYGVIDGRPVPTEYVEVHVVDADEIVLASDGYPTLPATLTEAEADLARLLTEDPICVGPLQSTKSLTPGLLSYDDRAWLRIRL